MKSISLNKLRNPGMVKRKATINLPATEWSEKLWGKLISKIVQAKSEPEVKDLLEKLITEDEKSMILKRMAVAALVRSGKSYKEISESLWLSPNSISTVKKNMISNHKNYKSYLAFYGGPRQYSTTVEIKKAKSFWEELFGDADLLDILKNPPRPAGIGLLESARQNKLLNRRNK